MSLKTKGKTNHFELLFSMPCVIAQRVRFKQPSAICSKLPAVKIGC
jgi:hypothetical protein